MGSYINKNSNSTKNKNNKEKYNFNDNNQKNNQQENKNKISKVQQKEINNKNVKEEDDEIIIELEIDRKNGDDEEEINILCDKNELIEYNNLNEKYYKENNTEPLKIFDYFNENNTKLYLNNNEVTFGYKLKLAKIGINNIKIISKVKLFSLSSMFFFCKNINTIKFLKINTNNVTNMSNMFDGCKNLYQI